MKALEDLKEILEDELKEIVKKGDITPQELENAYKATDIIKDIETIKAMKEADYGGYSQDGYSRMYPVWNAYDGNSMDYSRRDGDRSYDSSYDGGSYARRGRDGDGDGRYSEDGRSYDGNSYRRGRDARGRYTSRDGYSRDTEKDKMLEKLHKMMETASSEREREAIRQCIDKLDD